MEPENKLELHTLDEIQEQLKLTRLAELYNARASEEIQTHDDGSRLVFEPVVETCTDWDQFYQGDNHDVWAPLPEVKREGFKINIVNSEGNDVAGIMYLEKMPGAFYVAGSHHSDLERADQIAKKSGAAAAVSARLLRPGMM
jgi:hypothetical protein